MKILIIGPLPDPIDGCSFSNQILCDNLTKANVDYDVINTNSKNVSSKQGGRFSVKKAIDFCKVYFEINKIRKSNSVYFTPGQTFFGLLKYAPFIWFCKFINTPYVIHIHGNYLGEQYSILKGFKKKIFGNLIKGASAGIVLSDSLRNNFKGLLAEKKIHVVENFVANNFFERYNSNIKNRNYLQIVYLSNLMEGKGVLDLLDALIILKEKNIKFKAVFAGKIENLIKDQVESKFQNLKDEVKYLGVVKGDEKVKVLNNSNVFVLPTFYQMEGQPISILEAMASGNIVVTTRHAGIPDVISENNGYFVEKKSPKHLSRILAEISEEITKKINVFEKTNVYYAKSYFTEQKFSNKILKILEKSFLNDD